MSEENEIIKEEPNRGCDFYNWGDNPNFDYPCPREYGARCEKYDKFFSRFNGELNPSCKNCGEKSLEGRIE